MCRFLWDSSPRARGVTLAVFEDCDLRTGCAELVRALPPWRRGIISTMGEGRNACFGRAWVLLQEKRKMLELKVQGRLLAISKRETKDFGSSGDTVLRRCSSRRS